ncbi:MAG TPA: serine hydrolase domain-containing protein [Vineibacter sp.]|nr:serine hydrolase domain-containing protein [Vineibacter sp.]
MADLKHACAVVVAGVLLATPAAIAQQPTAVATAKPNGQGDVQGMSRERLARIAPAMKGQVDEGVFPGVVTMVARRGQLVHFEAHGFLDAAKSKPMPKDALFRLASMTKPIVSVAAVMMIERGDMKLHDPIARWLPELKDVKVETRKTDKEGKEVVEDVAPNRPILVHDLLRHTAGFVYAGAAKSARIKEMYEKANIEARDSEISGDDMLKALGAIPLTHQPGTFWEYAITTDVLGLLLERVAKKPLDQILKELLFDPLGMTETTFRLPAAKQARVAEAFPSDPLAPAMGKSYAIHFSPGSKSYLRGGAGLIGTADDYLKFAQMVVNGGELNGRRFMSKKTVEFMLSNHIAGMGGTTIATTGPGYGFGLGWGVRLDEGMGYAPGSKGDAMWAGAWGTSFWVDPKERLVGILMSQAPSRRYDTRMLMKNLVYGAVVN